MKRRSRRHPAPRDITPPRSMHFTREGLPKKSYRTEQEAKAAAHMAWTLNRAELDTYRCAHCHQWHMGGRFRSE